MAFDFVEGISVAFSLRLILLCSQGSICYFPQSSLSCPVIASFQWLQALWLRLSTCVLSVSLVLLTHTIGLLLTLHHGFCTLPAHKPSWSPGISNSGFPPFFSFLFFSFSFFFNLKIYFNRSDVPQGISCFCLDGRTKRLSQCTCRDEGSIGIREDGRLGQEVTFVTQRSR